MGKKPSKLPKPSKTFQKRPNVPQHVIQRIIDLKNQGMGFIRISNILKKEGLAISGIMQGAQIGFLAQGTLWFSSSTYNDDGWGISLASE